MPEAFPGEHVCHCGLFVSEHESRCDVCDEHHFPPLCCRGCPCRSVIAAHPELADLGPLTCVVPGIWRSKDGYWTFQHIEHDDRWYVYEDGSDWPTSRHPTLRDARAEVVHQLADRATQETV